jgi:hypothetical protein
MRQRKHENHGFLGVLPNTETSTVASRGKTTSFSDETQALVNQNIGAELSDVLLLVIFL